MNKDKLMGIKQRFAAGEIKQQHLEMQVFKEVYESDPAKVRMHVMTQQ